MCMTSRERVRRTLNHQTPDRVPMDLGGAASSLNDEAYFKFKGYLGIVGEIEPFRKGTTTNYYDERILDKLEIDFRRIILKRKDCFPHFFKDGSFVNEWGVKYAKKGEYYEILENPLANADKLQIKNFTWPKAVDVFESNGLLEHTQELYKNTDYALVARMPSWGLFDIACQLRGMEQFMVDMMTEPAIAHLLIEKILESQMDFYSMLLDRSGKFVEMVETCDDYGSQNGLLFSPALFKQIIKPYRLQLNNLIRKKAPDAKIFLHCCGGIFDLIPDIIDTGVDVINPIQPNAAGMDAGRLKEIYGNDICFHGGIDTQKALLGSKSELIPEVKKKIDLLSEKGGYIVAPANHIMSDVPPENIIALYETAKTYRRYL